MTVQTQPSRKIFDRRRFFRLREKAAHNFVDYAFVFERVMDDLVDRLESTNRQFNRAMFYGASHHGYQLQDALTMKCGVGVFFLADSASSRLKEAKEPKFVYDDEWVPVADNSLDLFVSVLSLHAVNDVIGALIQARRALKPDGLFIGALFGEDTLRATQKSFLQHDINHCGGAHMRFSPTATMQSLGTAMQRAGFALPVIDKVSTSVHYADPKRVFDDLKGMGERNYLTERAGNLPKRVIKGVLADATKNSLPIQYDVIMLTGWSPHDSQQKPLKPGSATQSLQQSILQAERTSPKDL